METMWTTIGAALISAAAAILVSVIQHRKSTALIEYKVDELKKEVEKHNNLVERTFELEKDVEVIRNDIKVANHRIDDLEKKG
jgi:outer membrane murein-binding lipoprotein Lpp